MTVILDESANSGPLVLAGLLSACVTHATFSGRDYGHHSSLRSPYVGGRENPGTPGSWRVESCTIDLGHDEKLRLPVSSHPYGSPEIAHAALRAQAWGHSTVWPERTGR